eukprot:7178916-Prorocentrum_lima.AAC.1
MKIGGIGRRVGCLGPVAEQAKADDGMAGKQQTTQPGRVREGGKPTGEWRKGKVGLPAGRRPGGRAVWAGQE